MSRAWAVKLQAAAVVRSGSEGRDVTGLWCGGGVGRVSTDADGCVGAAIAKLPGAACVRRMLGTAIGGWFEQQRCMRLVRGDTPCPQRLQEDGKR